MKYSSRYFIYILIQISSPNKMNYIEKNCSLHELIKCGSQARAELAGVIKFSQRSLSCKSVAATISRGETLGAHEEIITASMAISFELLCHGAAAISWKSLP